MIFLSYLLLGSLAGLTAGIFGVGGGIIIVPALIFTFGLLGFPSEIAAHVAVGTSLSTILFTSLGSIHGHHKKKAINWPLAINLSIGMLVGGMLGAYFADFLSGPLLQKIFAAYAFIVSVQMWFSWSPKANWQLPERFGRGILGGFIGTFSGLFGIAGGSLLVPVLTAYKVKITEAIATSAVTGFPIAISGTIGYILMGWNRTDLPEHSVGYVYLPALIGIIATSTIFAKIGASLAHRLDPAKVTKLFSILLFIIAIKLII